jgi:threonine synthase
VAQKCIPISSSSLTAMSSRLTHLQCSRCGKEHPADRLQSRCSCGGTLLPRYDLSPLGLSLVRERPPGMWRYQELLPLAHSPISLGEALTPLLAAPALSERWGVEVFVKDDAALPGSTFKARGAAVGLSRAVELGATEIVMPSAGNAGGAWALYAARAGIALTVTMAQTAPKANQAEVRFAGAELVLVPGTIADAGTRAKEIASERGAFLTTTFSEPYRVEGKKTAWLEVFDALGTDSEMRFPKTIVMPVGGGVAAIAAAKAAEEVSALGWVQGTAPQLIGVQARTCAPIAEAFGRGDTEVPAWSGAADTIAAGLRVPAPAEGALVLEVIRASGGSMLAVSEEAIVDAARVLAASEGIFACPEGAATVAAAGALAERGQLEGPVVLYNTGAGAKYAEAFAAARG